MRVDGRGNDVLRPVTIEPNYLEYADGSVLISCGKTKVLCAATIEASVPPWLEGRGTGWITGEYGMLPCSTTTRRRRETQGLSGRTQEIRRLVGRTLRASVDLSALGERMILIDCDVIQADGGTRTASITGGYVALALALRRLIEGGLVEEDVYKPPVAAVSAGLFGGRAMLDLCYEEDSRAEVDFNVVMNASGKYIEIQGCAEGDAFSQEQLNALLGLARGGITQLLGIQSKALKG